MATFEDGIYFLTTLGYPVQYFDSPFYGIGKSAAPLKITIIVHTY